MREHAQSKVIRRKECGKEISGEELSRRNIWHRPKAESDVAIGGGSDKAYGRRVINVDSGGAGTDGEAEGNGTWTAGTPGDHVELNTPQLSSAPPAAREAEKV